MEKILKQIQQMNADMRQANADLTANMNAKSEQITGEERLQFSELNAETEDAQVDHYLQPIGQGPVSYTHLDVYKRQPLPKATRN